MLKTNPGLANTLFDFSSPHKIDLESFMNQNFHFNVKMDKFAYLTGRSLAAFKLDFNQEFGISPGRWLIRKSLKEAYKLLF